VRRPLRGLLSFLARFFCLDALVLCLFKCSALVTLVWLAAGSFMLFFRAFRNYRLAVRVCWAQPWLGSAMTEAFVLFPSGARRVPPFLDKLDPSLHRRGGVHRRGAADGWWLVFPYPHSHPRAGSSPVLFFLPFLLTSQHAIRCAHPARVPAFCQAF